MPVCTGAVNGSACDVGRTLEQAQSKGQAYAGWVVEPVVQGVAGMVVQPEGWLKRVGRLARQAGIPLIFDEVMTGFGRTGPVFASHGEGVQADFLCLAKGMSGGYLPMAATLVWMIFSQLPGVVRFR